MRGTAVAASGSGYRAMVGLFLFGGNDGWNMLVPNGSAYGAYSEARGAVAIKREVLIPLSGVGYGMHPSFAPLAPFWDQGKLSFVLNTGTLHAPLTKSLYNSREDLRPTKLFSHTDEEAHWQGLRARTSSDTGFMGRIADRSAISDVPSTISFAGANLAVAGAQSSALILPEAGALRLNQEMRSELAGAIAAFDSADGLGEIAAVTDGQIDANRGLASRMDALLADGGLAQSFFIDPATGQLLNSSVARQLLRVARMIEMRQTLGHSRQSFFVGSNGFDTHANQVEGNSASGTHAVLLHHVAAAVAAFYRAIEAMGLADTVTLFTMSDFGRTSKANDQRGTDHGWGNVQMVLGGGLRGHHIHGTHPSFELGGADDATGEGRFIPTLSSEQYLAAIAQWHGVGADNMGYVFPNWSEWSGRGAVPLYA
ncbi:DUF1501 domain-containing protein [Sphingomonas sp. R647]|uniref:DUF1501 domain-containing protein n=1 Tax=Sphingomonas sp. R647 TaxID=2875233 RepID=UPI001CD637C8|nr:DUF1501 domain-containing protein [Sphingomonas sp. R647]